MTPCLYFLAGLAIGLIVGANIGVTIMCALFLSRTCERGEG